MSRQVPTRKVTAAEARAYLVKAEEFLDASRAALDAQQSTAATSLAIHAAINAAGPAALDARLQQIAAQFPQV